MIFFSHFANFSVIFVRKMSKSLNISLKNNSCYLLKKILLYVNLSISLLKGYL